MTEPSWYGWYGWYGLVAQQLDRIERNQWRLMRAIGKLEADIMADLAELTAQVQKNTDVESSAVTLIQGIAARLAAAAGDPAAITALSNELKASADSLSAAIVANTPAA